LMLKLHVTYSLPSIMRRVPPLPSQMRPTVPLTGTFPFRRAKQLQIYSPHVGPAGSVHLLEPVAWAH
jgi:hypothetical protein